MKSEKPILERADKIAIAVAVAAFLVYSVLLTNDHHRYVNKQQAEQTQKAVEKAKSDTVKTVQFYQQNTK